MSQPRRRRRRRRRGTTDRAKKQQVKRDQKASEANAGTQTSRRSRRGRSKRPAREPTVESAEQLLRGKATRPRNLTGPHDGTTLEQVIGELQSNFGVPQHPQEFRITLKVADDKEGRERAAVIEETEEQRDGGTPVAASQAGRPRREKAPAAPRIGTGGAEAETATSSGSGKRSRRRRRRSRGKGRG
jgi:hypothetical protein